MPRLLETPSDVYVLFGAWMAAATLFISLGVGLYPFIGEAYMNLASSVLGHG